MLAKLNIICTVINIILTVIYCSYDTRLPTVERDIQPKSVTWSGHVINQSCWVDPNAADYLDKYHNDIENNNWMKKIPESEMLR